MITKNVAVVTSMNSESDCDDEEKVLQNVLSRIKGNLLEVVMKRWNSGKWWKGWAVFRSAIIIIAIAGVVQAAARKVQRSLNDSSSWGLMYCFKERTMPIFIKLVN